MKNLKRIISLSLSLVIVISSIFVGGITALAETSLYSTVNTYDDASNTTLTNITNDSQPAIQAGSTTPYFGSYGATIVQNPLNAASNNVVKFDRAKAPTDNWPAAVRIYKQGTGSTQTSFEHFKPKTETTYEIEFKYYVQTAPTKANVNLQVRLTPHSQLYGNSAYAYNNHVVWNVETITKGTTTNGWITVKTRITTPATEGYLGFFAASESTAMYSGLAIYVDDITVRECASLTIHNYDGADKVVPVTDNDAISSLTPPVRDGYIFKGVFADAQLTQKISDSAKAINYINAGVYFGWDKLNDGEYFTGFENFTIDTNGISFDDSVTSIVSSSAYAGAKAIKNILSNKNLVSFELRDASALRVHTNKEYTISFAYSSTASVNLYAGLAAASNVPGSAYAVASTTLANTNGAWQIASIKVTFDKNLAEGFVPVFMLRADTNATVMIDDVYFTLLSEQAAINSAATTNTDVSVNTATGTVKHFTVRVNKNQKTLPSKWPDASYDVSSLSEVECVLKLPTNYSEDGAPVPVIMFADGYGQYITNSSWHGDQVSQFTTQGYAVFEIDNIEGKNFGIKDLGCPAKVRAAMKAFEHIKEYYNVQDKMITIGVSNGTLLALEIMDWYPEVVSCGIIGGPNVSLRESYLASDNWGSNNNSAAVYYDFANKLPYYASSAHDRGQGEYDKTVGDKYDYYEHVYTKDGVQYLDKQIPPVLFLIGEDEPATPKKNAITVSQALANSGNTVVVKRYAGTAHGPVCSISREDILADALSFMETYKGSGCEHKNSVNVPAKAATCASYGNNAYTKCYDCGTVLSGSAAVIPKTEHVFDNNSDTFCNNCNTPRNLWDSKTSQPTNTDANGYILISNGQELAWVIKNGGGAGSKYKLTNDIYLNSPDKINWTTGVHDTDYKVNVWYDHSEDFQGTIDGDGHVIYGLYFNSPGSSSGLYGSGLIPKVNESTSVTIKNLGIDNAYINSHSTSAFVATSGNSSSIVMDNCYAGANVTLVAGRDAGVLGGRIQGTITVTNCYSLANASGGTSNGLLGDVWSKSTIANSYNANGPVSYGTNTSYHVTATNCYATSISKSADGTHVMKTPTVITAASMQGTDALTNESKMPNLGDAFVATSTYPILVVKVNETPEPDEPEVPEEPSGCEHEYYDAYHAECLKCGQERTVSERPIVIWDKTTTAPSKTDADGNIIIATASELAYIIANGGGAGNKYKLIADIYLNDITKINWTTGVVTEGYTANTWYDHGKTFQGTIDGDGHVIYGMYFNSPGSANGLYGSGLIPKVDANASVVIKNLGVENAYVNSHSASAFVGVAGNSSSIVMDNCYAGANVTLVAGRDAGALAGRIQGAVTISNCYSLATVTGGNSNGLLGDIWSKSTITNCYNATGPISYGTNTGYYTTATNCYAVSVSTNASGGHAMKTPTVITAANMQGTDVLTNASKMPNLGAAFVATINYPVLKVFPVKVQICEHTYDNACDADCNKCGDIREVEDHVYDDEYDADCNICGDIRDVPDRPIEFDDTVVKEYLASQSNNSANYLIVSSLKDLALAEKLANENDDIDFVVIYGINGTITTTKPVIVFDSNNKFVDINDKKLRVICLSGSDDADMSWFVNTALTCDNDWNYIIFSDEVIAERPDNGVIGEADQTLWKILYDFQNMNYYLNEGLGIDADWTNETSKILLYQLIGAAEDGKSYRDDIDLWLVSSSTLDLMTVHKNINFRLPVTADKSEYMISTFVQPEGDVNIDGKLDVTDLVKFNLIARGENLPTARINNLDAAKLRLMILGEPIYLPIYYQSHVAEKADEINEYLANTSDNTAVYLYWTDAHWNRNYENSYKILKYLSQVTPANHTIFGGDVANDTDPTADDINEWRILSLRLPNHHSVVGNHEYTSPHLQVKDNREESYSNIYNFLLAPEFEQSGVTNSLGENQLCYYVDNETEKTRYMFLKCSRGPESGVTYEEFKWTVESLNSTPAGWHIVMIGHEWLNGTSYAQANCRAFGRIADAYNAREVGTTDFFSVAYDFSKAAATVEYIIGGDNHTDIDNASSSGKIPVITLETDCVRGEPTAIGGTISENCVNVIIADYDNNTFKVFRVGRDDDIKITMKPTGTTSAKTTTNITNVDGQYITDYIDLSKPKINNYKSRNDAYLLISGGSTTVSNYVVEFYNYDSSTGAYNVASGYNVTLGGSLTFKAGDTPISNTYPVVYDVRDGNVYIDLTAVSFRHKNKPTEYPQYVRIKYKGSATNITVNYTTPK